jgi:metal-responsive CopG/Arc/MetJ family transcriptional regulator
MQSDLCVKKSISLPQDLWDFVEDVKGTQGQGQTSKVVQKALRCLKRNLARRKQFQEVA